MRLPRMTTRRWMIVVAVAALVVGFIRLWTLRHLYLEKAANHASFRAHVLRTPESTAYWENRWTDQRRGLPARYPWPAGPPFVPAMGEYHDAMRIKYERAARYPWLPVEPDPPEPK
jgi:hypothetical protein